MSKPAAAIRKVKSDVDIDILRVIYGWADYLRVEHGFPAPHAAVIAQGLADYTRGQHGGARLYVHALSKPDVRARDAEIRALYNGRNAKVVCEQLGVSRATLKRAVGPGGREKRLQATRDRDGRIAAAYKGTIDEALCKQLRLSYSSIHDSLRRQGLR